MPKVKGTNSSSSSQEMRPPISPENKQSQMIALAMDAAEKQLRDGTASSQVITHFLKLATEEKRLELEKLRAENKLLVAKTEQIESQKNTEKLYKDAIAAMKRYGGYGNCEVDDDDEY